MKDKLEGIHRQVVCGHAVYCVKLRTVSHDTWYGVAWRRGGEAERRRDILGPYDHLGLSEDQWDHRVAIG